MNKKKTIIAICILGILVSVFLLLNTYAFWKVQKKNKTAQKASSACLSIVYQDLSDSIYIKDAWPTSDEDGVSSVPYVFKVQNKCNYDINYQIVLESIPTTAKNYMGYSNIKVQLDNGSIQRYSLLTDGLKDSQAGYTIRDAKNLSSQVVKANRYNTHKLRLWLASDASLDVRGQEFNGKIKVFAGDGINEPELVFTDENCFVFDADTGTITGYKQNGTCSQIKLILPATIGGKLVKSINFDNNSRSIAWKTVELQYATGLESIGDWSFWGFLGNNQTTLKLPSSLKYIGEKSFSRYRGSKIVLGNNVEIIGKNAFENYQGTNQELVIPSSVKTISNWAFAAFSGSKLTFAESPGQSKLETIGDYAFTAYNSTSKLGANLVLPNNLKTIGNSAFSGYRGGQINFGRGITHIDAYAFKDYIGQNDYLDLSSAPIERIEAGAFEKFDGTALYLGNKLKYIGSGVFNAYTGKNNYSLTIPDNVETISDFAFKNFKGANLLLAQNMNSSHLTDIGVQAFYSFNKSVHIPPSVNRIGNSAFNSIPYGYVLYFHKPNLCGMTLEPAYNGSALTECFIDDYFQPCPTTCP